MKTSNAIDILHRRYRSVACIPPPRPRTWRTSNTSDRWGLGVDRDGIVIMCGDWTWHFRCYWRAL